MNVSYTFGSSYWRTIEEGVEREWLLTNGLGGYSGHTIVGGGNRLYHGYLVASTKPPVNRYLVFTRTQEQLTIGERKYDLTSQNYINWAKTGHNYLTKFNFDGVPHYYYQVEDVNIKKTISMEYGHNTVVVCYEIENGLEEAKLNLVPLFNFKSPSESASKDDLKFDLHIDGNILKLIPKTNRDITISFYKSEGEYYDRKLIPTNMTTPNYLIEENHFYKYENDNGFTGVDNHYTPYEIHIDLKPFEKKKFYVKCSIEGIDEKDGFTIVNEYQKRQESLLDKAQYKDEFAQALVLSADNFIVNRQSTGLKTIVAGYPWFMDWGRDTMIALHGLTLCTKRYDDAKQILESFSQYVKKGLIPNVFPDYNQDPAYNTVDASLWYFYAVDMYLKHTNDYDFIKLKIYHKLKEIIEAYKNGTDFDIYMDSDGLINAGNGKCQLTWMDAMIGDWVVTPRHGKPVEVNALWYNALCVMGKLAKIYGEDEKDYADLADKVKESFNNKFWNDKEQCLYDVVDEYEDKIRPNQIWAISLPYTMLPKEKEIKVVQKVYKHLYTPYGLRSLSFTDENFVPKYEGKMFNRDASYHMGTTWAYPLGAFITAYCKVNDYSKDAVKKAREMCLIFKQHLSDGCINGISEIFDGEFANKGKGCYNQAWSVSEILRAYTESVLPYYRS